MELQPGEIGQWTVYFDAGHHRSFGDHNHSVVLKSNDADQASLSIPTLATVVESGSGATNGG